MRNISNSIKWIIWLPFLVSLISFSGFAKSSIIAKSNPTELVDTSKSNSSNSLSVNFSSTSVVQKEISKHLLLEFSESLNFASTSYHIKRKVQNQSFLDSFNSYLVVLYLLKSDYSDGSFIA